MSDTAGGEPATFESLMSADSLLGADADAGDSDGLTVDDVLDGKALPDAEGGEAAEPVEAADPEPEDEPEPESSALGAEANPYTVKTLPKDMHIQVKIDGEEVTMTARDAVEGHMRQSAYNKKVNDVVGEAQRVKGIVAAGEAKHEKFRRGVLNTLSDGEKLDAYMEEYNPEAWEKAIRIGLNRMVQLSEGSEEDRIRYRVGRATRAANRQAQAAQTRQRDLDQRESASRVRENRTAVIKPALDRAMAQVGSPKLEKAESQEVLSDMGTMMELASSKLGRDLSSEEIEMVMLKTLRNHGYVAPKLTPPKRAKKTKAPEVRRGRGRQARAKKPEPARQVRRAVGGAWDTDALLGDS